VPNISSHDCAYRRPLRMMMQPWSCRVSTTSGNLLEYEIPSDRNTINLLEINCTSTGCLFSTGLPINSVYFCTSFISTRHHPISKDIVTPTASVSSRGQLQSTSSSRYEQPRMRLKFGQRCFSYDAPAAWNTLPPSLQQLTNTDSFKRQLKTVLFERDFLV